MPIDPKLWRATLDEFLAWFASEDGFNHSIDPQVARETWKRAKKRAEARVDSASQSRWADLWRPFSTTPDDDGFAGVLPSWTDLRFAMDTMAMPKDEMPSKSRHFWVCFVRYCIKMLRTRVRIYALCLILVILGVICGVLHGAPPARNDLLIYYMIFNTLFSVVCATATSATFGGPTDFFHHEAASGIRQGAEGLARILADVLWLVLFAPVFILTLRTFAVLRAELAATWLLTTWAMSTFGYIFMLIAPANANVLTATMVVLVCTLTNGLFGVKAVALGPMRGLLHISPGYNSYLLVSVGAIVAEPFDVTRAFLMNLLRVAGLLPVSRADVYAYETEQFPWRSNSHRDLLLFGLIGRIIALVLFYLRSHYSFEGLLKHIFSRISDMACCVCCQDRALREDERMLERGRSMLALADPDELERSVGPSSKSTKRNTVAKAGDAVQQAIAAVNPFVGGSRGTTPLSPADVQRDWLSRSEMAMFEEDNNDESPTRAQGPTLTPSSALKGLKQALFGSRGMSSPSSDPGRRRVVNDPLSSPAGAVKSAPGTQDSALSPVSCMRLANGATLGQAVWLPS